MRKLVNLCNMVHSISIALYDKETGENLGSTRRNLPYERMADGRNPAKDFIQRWVDCTIRGRELNDKRKLHLTLDIEPAYNFYVESKLPFHDEAFG